MIEAIGLTSACRRDGAPIVDDLTFEARPGAVTGLLGAPGSGKSVALRLMLELEPGRGVTLFDGRPMHRLPHPAREVGVLLGAAHGHPGRTARGHLRMLAAAAGVPASRADEVLELVGLAGVARQRLDAFSLGMDRRVGLAAALLGDPHILVLDEPAVGLSAREVAWMSALMRAFAAQGGVVLVTGSDAKEMAATADHIVSIDAGRLVADQPAAEFARTRLRPRVVVRSPHAHLLAHVLAAEGVEVADEGGFRVAVFGADRVLVGEAAYRNGILLHELADQVVDGGPQLPTARIDAERPRAGHEAHRPGRHHPEPPTGGATAGSAATATSAAGAARAAQCPAPPLPGPAWLLRYEWRRLAGIRSTWLTVGGVLALDLVIALFLGRPTSAGGPGKDVHRLLTAWAPGLPLPPAALGAGLLGALAFGQEFRYPALAPAQAPIRRRMRLLVVKLGVCATGSLLLAAAALLLNAVIARYAVHPPLDVLRDQRLPLLAGWVWLVVACAWAGLLAAGVSRSALVGALSVLAVPLLVEPAVRWALADPVLERALDVVSHFAASVAGGWLYPLEQVVVTAHYLASGSVEYAFAMTVICLLSAYVFLAVRRRPA